MTNFNVRIEDGLAARFDAWAAGRGGRSPALRHLIETACRPAGGGPAGERLDPRPVKLTVRLSARYSAGLSALAAEFGLTPNAWVAALVRRAVQGRPTFRRADELLLIAIAGEVRRIGVNLNQMARALNTAVLEGRVLHTQLVAVGDFRRELRAHLTGLLEAFEGNLSYWSTDL
ncbi:plasmid mobilization relaxosome protein MobC [Phenylobacterium sp.]|uniref:plasmid mobilization relaxosome protein MobC n=1 Tax=Phenylobacterium sp. TaxID=1871053 RepID=UPI0035619121